MRNYGRYKNIRNASWQALIDFNISQLPVALADIANQAGIKIISNSNCHVLNCNQIGLSICSNDKWYIIYDDANTKERCRFTIAHEFGHIFLGHSLTDSGLFRTAGTNNKPEEEQAADMFAIRLLAPACVLKGLDLHTAKEIADTCRISMQAAQYRANRMKILYDRNKFFFNPLERRVYKNFEKYIHRKKELNYMGLFNKNYDVSKSRILYISGLPANYTKSLMYLVVNEESGALQFKKSLESEECVNLSISKIKSFTTITEEKVKEVSGVGRAVAGGLIFGAAGAVVGAVTAKDKKKKEFFECITYISNDAEKTIIFKNADSNCLKFNDYLRKLISKNYSQSSTTIDL